MRILQNISGINPLGAIIGSITACGGGGGSSGLVALAGTPANEEVGEVTADGWVVYNRDVGRPNNDIYGIKVDGSESEIPLTTSIDDDVFGEAL